MRVGGTTGTSLAERAIRRSVVSGTHQAIVVGALWALGAPEAVAWRRLLLRHAGLLAEGADAPDSDFRDYKNHVLFADGWGGAVEKSEAWYRNLVSALRRSEWGKAAFAAGVLSHYLSDPLHPFHTAITAASSDIHFATDTAVRLTYPALARQAGLEVAPRRFDIGPGAAELASTLGAAAGGARGKFDQLIKHFDFERARRNPANALDADGRRMMAEFIAEATGMVAAAFDSAIREAEVAPPRVSLALPLLKAWVGKPITSVERGLGRRAAKRAVRRMARERERSGGVNRTLRGEERGIREAYAKELASRPVQIVIAEPRKQIAAAAMGKVLPFEARPSARAPVPDQRPMVAASALIEPSVARDPMPSTEQGGPFVLKTIPAEAHFPRPSAVISDALASRYVPPPAPPAGKVAARPASEVAALSHAGAALLAPGLSGGISNFRDRRSQSSAHSSGSGAAIAPSTRADWLPADEPPKATDLIAAIPGLRHGEAQLMLAAGYPTVDAIAAADVDRFCAAILSAVLTPAGRDALRDTPPPDVATVRIWAQRAVSAVRAA